MDYFKILNLSKEPFSNSPDPEFFFHSRQHLDCLQKLELSLRLRRGLNIVIGDIGTGKTTLGRQLIRRFSQQPNIEPHLILDPLVHNAYEFLAAVAEMLTGQKPSAENNEWQIKEQIKQHLFRKGVAENKTIVLIIDEGQKIPVFCLEILREFLNYETNEYKLLQIVIFAQKEFEETIRKHPNFADRINLYHMLKPLSFRDTRMMIKFRLEKSSNSPQKMGLFTFAALASVYRITGGYPRKIINLCHQSILTMIIQNRSNCGYRLVNSCAHRVFPDQARRIRWIRSAVMAAGAIVVALVIFLPTARFKLLQQDGIIGLTTLFSRLTNQTINLPVDDLKPQTFRAQIAATGFDNRQQNEHDSARFLKSGIEAPREPPDDKRDMPNSNPALNMNLTKTVENPNTGMKPTQETRLPQVKTEALIAAPLAYSPKAVLAQNTSEPTYSATLGQITMQRNETLSRIFRGVYGNFNSKNFESFIAANPDIEDPDRVKVGQTVSLPAFPLRVTPSNSRVWWIRISDRDSLEAAFNILRKYPESSSGVRLVPHWNPSDGTRFAVVINKLFEDEKTARQHLQQLPAELAANSTIMSHWDERTVYFANPYLN